MSDEQSWKNRYYDALGELEAKERAWSEAEQMLRQGLSRLSLAADASNETLNRQLERLRKLLRSHDNDEALGKLLEQISDSIRRLDESRQSQSGPQAATELLEQALGRIDFPRTLAPRATALQKRLLAS
ncbi:MAG: hypothetical protein ACQETD_11965, partial [Pseudomonadota bacterium]